MIRIRQGKSVSEKFKREILGELLGVLGKVIKKFPPKGQRNIVIGEIE